MSEVQEKHKELPSHSFVLPDINAMKKAILSEIGGVTEQDLNVMSAQEIEDFYKQLAIGMVEQGKKVNVDPGQDAIDNKKGKKKQSFQQVVKANNQNKSLKQTEAAFQKEININGSFYYRPKFIEDNTHIFTNRKLMITFGPEIKDIQDKRKAISEAYSCSLSQVIKSMKSQEIQDTYERLRLPQNRKHLYLKAEFQTVQFCVYVQRLQIDENLNFLDQQNLPTQNQNKDSQLKKDRLQKANEAANFISQHNNLQEQFFDQIPKNTTEGPILNEQNKQSKNKTAKNETSKTSTSSSLKQTIQSAKKKQKIETSAQTQKTKHENNKKTKTQITIISQVEYVEDPEEQEQELRPVLRPRPIDVDMKQYGNFPQKLNLEQFKKALEEPGQEPQEQVLSWIIKMRSLVNELEYNYLNQFRTNWTVIND